MGAKWNAEQKRKWLYANVKMIVDNMSDADVIVGVDLGSNKCATVVTSVELDDGEIRVIDKRVFGKSSRYSHWEKVEELGKNFNELLSKHQPTVVGFESVRSSRNFTGLRAMFLALTSLYSSLCDLDYDVPTQFDIPTLTPFVPSQLKKFLTGDGRAEKEDMMAATAEVGFPTEEDNEADAFAAAYTTMNLIRYAVWLYNDVLDLDNFDNVTVRNQMKACPDWLTEKQKEVLDAYLENDTFMKEIDKRRYAKVAKRIRKGKDFVNL